MDDLAMWSLLVGFISPLVISMIQRPKWSLLMRTTVTAAFSAIVGVGTSYLNDQLDGRSVVSSILLILVTALSTYKGLWRPSGIAPKIETLTTPGDQRVVQAIVVEPTAAEGSGTYPGE